jgi:hypothetical protein
MRKSTIFQPKPFLATSSLKRILQAGLKRSSSVFFPSPALDELREVTGPGASTYFYFLLKKA